MTPFTAFERIAARVGPKTAVVLGSGLGPVIDALPTLTAMDFVDAGFATTTVHGHAGRVVLVEWGGVPVLAFRGRMHFYEGHAWSVCTRTVSLAAGLGVKEMLLTNAAGGIHDALNPGDLMAIRDHLPLLGAADWSRPASPSPYSPQAVARLQTIAARQGWSLMAGVYAGLTGPCYETPAEIRALRSLGADAVGMSTVKEALAAQELGITVAAISCITNKAAGLSMLKLSHADVQDVASRADVVARLAGLIAEFLQTPRVR